MDDDGDECIYISDDETDTIVFGVDPGTVNCGICEYNVTAGRARRLERIQFRSSRAEGDKESEDPGNAKIVDSVVAYLFDNEERFDGRLFFVEDQNTYQQEGRQKHCREVLAVQHTLQAILGSENCIAVSPSSVKSEFGEHFPKKPDLQALPSAKRTKAQYAHDKRSAVTAGRKLVPPAVREAYELANPGKRDDAYDAFFVALYGATRWFDRVDGAPRRRKTLKRAKKRCGVSRRKQ